MRRLLALGFVLSSLAQAQPAQVPAYAETAPLPASNPAYGTPALWLHPSDLTRSLILAADGTTALEVYDLAGGAPIAQISGAFSQVDVTYGFPLGSTRTELVAARALDGTVRFFTVDASTRVLTEVGQSPPLTLTAG